MRRFLAAAMIVVAVAFPAALHDPASAVACTIVPFERAGLVDTIEHTDIIVVGTLEESEGDALLLTVEEGLKGALAGEQLLVNNATNLDCLETHEPGRRNYPEGARVLVFLVPDTFDIADYKVARYGWDIFRIDPDGETLVLHVRDAESPPGLPGLAEVREAVESAPGAPPVNPDETVDPIAEADPGSGTRRWTTVAALVLVAAALVAGAGAVVIRRRI